MKSPVLGSQFITLLAFLAYVFSVAAQPSTLFDEQTGRALGGDARKVIVLIHGWNPTDEANAYASGEWLYLLTTLKLKLAGSGWKIVTYHWERGEFGANTGDVLKSLSDATGYGNATVAAVNAKYQGGVLANLLKLQSPNLRAVQFVAHSAGSWCAREAMLQLLNANPYVTAQMTLLDPFIPDAQDGLPLVSVSTGLSTTLMSSTANLLVADRILSLENYFADDFISQRGLTISTQEKFSWRTRDINQQVDWGGTLTPGLHIYYDFHSGPIGFYGDTIEASLTGGIIPDGLAAPGCPLDYTRIGWFRSMVTRTDSGQVPRILTSPVGTTARPGDTVSLTVSAIGGSGSYGYQWYKDSHLLIGKTSATYTFTATDTAPADYVAQVTDSASNTVFSDSATVFVYAAPPTGPTITSVSPSSFVGKPLPQTQLIKIYGTGFNSSSTLVFQGTIASSPARLYFINENEIDYDVATDVAASNWKVVVKNGDSVSNEGHFSVLAPADNSGTLTVTLTPSTAVNSGAQWKIDAGGFRNSGESAPGLTPGTHTLSFKDVVGFIKPPDKVVTIVVGSNTQTGDYTPVTPTSYTLTLLQPANGTISAQPLGLNGSYTYAKGTVVELYGQPSFTYHLANWGGAASGSVNPISITMDGDKTVTATFAPGDPSLGTFRVVADPPDAAVAGAKWSLPGHADLRDFGTSYTTYPGIYMLGIHNVDGWIGPTEVPVSVLAGVTKDVVVHFDKDTTPALLTVTLSPQDSATATAKWHVNGGTYASGSTVSLAPGTYTVSFDGVDGWTKPGDQALSLVRGQSKVINAAYSPAAGQPVAFSVSPVSSPVNGGIVLTINGVNFTSPAAVTIGGKPAQNVTVVDPTLITCIVPPASAFGSASVTVQTAGGASTVANQFTYGATLGDKIDLAGAFGGSGIGLAVRGQFAYVGEGRNLHVLDVTTPASPIKKSKVTLPSTVLDVALFTDYAYVAAREGGVQVVDVSNPNAAALRGQYLPAGDTSVQAIKVFGGLAYVVDYASGLRILDLESPTQPVELSLLNINDLGGRPTSIGVSATPGGLVAYVSTDRLLCVVDVTNPRSPLLKGTVQLQGDTGWNLAISGNYVYVADMSVINIIDVSNPSAPSKVGTGSIFSPLAVAAAADKVYALSSSSLSGFFVWSAGGGTLSELARLAGPAADSVGVKMVISGNVAYLARGSMGLETIDISDSRNPHILGEFRDGAAYGITVAVGTSGNTLIRNEGQFGESSFKTVDISNPSQLQTLGTISEAGQGWGNTVATKSGFVYMLANQGLKVINVSSPSSPQKVATLGSDAIFAGYAITTSGNYMYTVGIDSGYVPQVVVIDASNPSAPTVRGSKSFSAFPTYSNRSYLSASGARVVVAITRGSESRLGILDVSNPSAPNELGWIDIATKAAGVQISQNGNFAYVIEDADPSVLRIANITQPTNIQFNTAVPLDGPGTAIQRRGDELFVGTKKGLKVFDIRDPGAPVLRRSYFTPGVFDICTPSEPASQSQAIYIATRDGGVLGLVEQDLQAPVVLITNPFDSTIVKTTSTLSMGGGASDNVGITGLSWSSSRGGSGQITPPFDNWFVNGIHLEPGENVITISAVDAFGNRGTATRTVTYNAPKQDQTVTLQPLAGRVFGDQPFRLLAAASSGLGVTFEVSGPGSLSDGNLVTIGGVGSVTVRALQTGNEFYNPAPSVEQTFTISKRDQTISFGTMPDRPISSFPITLDASASSGLPVVFTLETGGASINGSTLTASSGGLIQVRASQAGNQNYNSAPDVVRTFQVLKIPQTILFGELSGQTVGDAPFPIAATSTAGLPVQFSVAGPAFISGNLLTITGPGVVTILASQPGNSVYEAAPPVARSLTVNPMRISKINVSNGKVALEWPAKAGMRYRIHYSDVIGAPWSLLNEVSPASDTATFSDLLAPATRFYIIELIAPTP